MRETNKSRKHELKNGQVFMIHRQEITDRIRSRAPQLGKFVSRTLDNDFVFLNNRYKYDKLLHWHQPKEQLEPSQCRAPTPLTFLLLVGTVSQPGSSSAGAATA